MSLKARFTATYISAVVAMATPTVAYYEGLHLKEYLDPIGLATVCYGETDKDKLGKTYTKEQCGQMLNVKLAYVAVRVGQMSAIELPVQTHAALSSFAYNVGLGAFSTSTLLRKLNAGDIEGACNELPRWNKAAGEILRGLINRRASERDLCLEGIRHA